MSAPRKSLVPPLASGSVEIRLELLKVPGAGVCPLKPCRVIIQGGIEGERAHQLVVHGIEPPR